MIDVAGSAVKIACSHLLVCIGGGGAQVETSRRARRWLQVESAREPCMGTHVRVVSARERRGSAADAQCQYERTWNLAPLDGLAVAQESRKTDVEVTQARRADGRGPSSSESAMRERRGRHDDLCRGEAELAAGAGRDSGRRLRSRRLDEGLRERRAWSVGEGVVTWSLRQEKSNIGVISGTRSGTGVASRRGGTSRGARAALALLNREGYNDNVRSRLMNIRRNWRGTWVEIAQHSGGYGDLWLAIGMGVVLLQRTVNEHAASEAGLPSFVGAMSSMLREAGPLRAPRDVWCSRGSDGEGPSGANTVKTRERFL
ncbi:hypothetical protein DFH09DRAFT_1094390 [Mycena vulgaris]|nr:hypothetical protein DFH09DRAFT_1094390 [Mycena vulgaris]